MVRQLTLVETVVQGLPGGPSAGGDGGGATTERHFVASVRSIAGSPLFFAYTVLARGAVPAASHMCGQLLGEAHVMRPEVGLPVQTVCREQEGRYKWAEVFLVFHGKLPAIP